MNKLNRSELTSRDFIGKLLRKLFFWLPLVVGLVHQILMWFFNIDRIYVFLDPPGHISPWVSIEIQWWIVLTFGTAILFFMVATDRLAQSLPDRLVYPLYIYLVYLLILVKPV